MSVSAEIREDQLADHVGERVWRVVVQRGPDGFVRYFTSPYGVGDRYLEELRECVAQMHYPSRRDWEGVLRTVRGLRDGPRWSVSLDSATVVLDDDGEVVTVWEGLPDFEQEVATDEEEWLEHEAMLDAEEDADEAPSEVTATKRVTTSGKSLILNVTPELRMLGLDYGDLVQVTIRRAE